MSKNGLQPIYYNSNQRKRSMRYRVIGMECLSSSTYRNKDFAMEANQNSSTNQVTDSNNPNQNTQSLYMKVKEGLKTIIAKIREAMNWTSNSLQNGRKIYLTKEAAQAFDIMKKFDLQPWVKNIRNVLDRGEGYENYLKGDTNVQALLNIQNKTIDDSYNVDNPAIVRTIGTNDIKRITDSANPALMEFEAMLDDIKVQRNEKAPKTLNSTINVLKRIISLSVKLIQLSDEYDNDKTSDNQDNNT